MSPRKWHAHRCETIGKKASGFLFKDWNRLCGQGQIVIVKVQRQLPLQCFGKLHHLSHIVRQYDDPRRAKHLVLKHGERTARKN